MPIRKTIICMNEVRPNGLGICACSLGSRFHDRSIPVVARYLEQEKYRRLVDASLVGDNCCL